jgi:hypothetical protein
MVDRSIWNGWVGERGRDKNNLIKMTGQCKVIDTTMKLHQAAKSGVVRGVNYSILLASN